jgi:hypothetical protein
VLGILSVVVPPWLRDQQIHLQEIKIMTRKEFNELSTIERTSLNKKLDKINLALLDIIDSIVEIDEDTIGIKLTKNLVVYNEGSCVSINKGYNIQVAKEIHLNPSKTVDESVTKMLDFNKE